MQHRISQLFAKEIEGKSVLITGGTGSFGHYIVRELLKYNLKKIIVFSRDEDKQFRMEAQLKAGRLGFAPGDEFKISDEEQFNIRNSWKEDVLNFALGDVRDSERVNEVMRNVDVVFHAAALKQVPFSEFHPFEAVKTNVIGARNVKIAAINNNVQKVVAISTDKAVKPVNTMGMSKAIQEKIMIADEEMNYDTKFACIRYGNVIGSRGSVVPFFKEKIMHNEPLPITHKGMTRFLLTLEDAIELVFNATVQTKDKEIFVKKAPATTIMQLAQVMAKSITGRSDYPIVEIGVRAGEKIHETLVSEEELHRTREEENYFVVYPHTFFLQLKKMNKLDFFEKIQLRDDYTSANTERLDDEGLKKFLKETGWIN